MGQQQRGESAGHNGGHTAGSQDSNMVQKRASPERKYGTANGESRGSKANSGDKPRTQGTGDSRIQGSREDRSWAPTLEYTQAAGGSEDREQGVL